MKIAIAGTGYVGLSLATLLAQHNEVVALDVVPDKVRMVNELISPIQDEYIEKFFAEAKQARWGDVQNEGETVNTKKKPRDLNLRATLDYADAFDGADFVVISTPTNYDEEQNFFDTASVEDIIEKVLTVNPQATMVIKSTIPVGYTDAVRAKYKIDNIFFSPEFLREGKALYDNLYPSRIIVGADTAKAHKFAELLKEAAEKKDVPVIFMGSAEAEAVKLFANTYLALRVAYFNELDTYAAAKGLDTRSIVEGVSLDPRVGEYYNNPSFGYGGYCLPKDTKQLLANYKDVPQNLIEAIVQANDTRKQFIAEEALKQKPKVIGFYRLTMKSNSDNFRSSAVQDILKRVMAEGVDVLVYEPALDAAEFNGAPVTSDLDSFKENCEVILANRMTEDLEDVRGKVYTRDLFYTD